ncbi:MAG: Tim44 domain-containing protein [Phyllobacteriaceae bacterium]|nr:Tim44 domain-containing protein [Phyllobacteriaceae bacterium]
MHLDIYTIVFFAIAVVIFVRLYGVLGQKNGSERPPFRLPDDADDGTAGNDNVIPMPRAGDAPRRDPVAPSAEEAPTADTPAETPLSAALRLIASADRSFDPVRFVDGAKIAYEMIVTAYAKGDRKMLKSLLSKEVMESFGRGLDERDQRGEKVDFTFVGLDRTEIVEAASTDGVARITVRFAAKVISVTRTADGTVVDGDASKLTDLVDVWTFAREMKASDPNWRLVETRAVA